MAILADASIYSPNVYQLAVSDPISGGPVTANTGLGGGGHGDGLANLQAQQLANRTRWLLDNKLSNASGSAAAPGWPMKDEPSTGAFRPSAGVLGLSVLGSERFRLTSMGAEVKGRLLVGAGVVGANVGVYDILIPRVGRLRAVNEANTDTIPLIGANALNQVEIPGTVSVPGKFLLGSVVERSYQAVVAGNDATGFAALLLHNVSDSAQGVRMDFARAGDASTTCRLRTYYDGGAWCFRMGTNDRLDAVEVRNGDWRILGAGQGLVLTSPDGATRRRIGIGNDGQLTNTFVPA